MNPTIYISTFARWEAGKIKYEDLEKFNLEKFNLEYPLQQSIPFIDDSRGGARGPNTPRNEIQD